MNTDEIIAYVRQTPGNTNPQVLKTQLETINSPIIIPLTDLTQGALTAYTLLTALSINNCFKAQFENSKLVEKLNGYKRGATVFLEIKESDSRNVSIAVPCSVVYSEEVNQLSANVTMYQVQSNTCFDIAINIQLYPSGIHTLVVALKNTYSPTELTDQ